MNDIDTQDQTQTQAQAVADTTATAAEQTTSEALATEATATTDTQAVAEVPAVTVPTEVATAPVVAAVAEVANWTEAAQEDPAFVIEPSIGRKLHFYPNGQQFHSEPKAIDDETPMDADVVYVWGSRMVNVTVRDHIGQVHAFTSVTLRQPDDAKPSNAYAEWMPFQAEQARKAAMATATVAA